MCGRVCCLLYGLEAYDGAGHRVLLSHNAASQIPGALASIQVCPDGGKWCDGEDLERNSVAGSTKARMGPIYIVRRRRLYRCLRSSSFTTQHNFRHRICIQLSTEIVVMSRNHVQSCAATHAVNSVDEHGPARSAIPSPSEEQSGPQPCQLLYQGDISLSRLQFCFCEQVHEYAWTCCYLELISWSDAQIVRKRKYPHLNTSLEVKIRPSCVHRRHKRIRLDLGYAMLSQRLFATPRVIVTAPAR